MRVTLVIRLLCCGSSIARASCRREPKAQELTQWCVILDVERLSFCDLVNFMVDLVLVTCEEISANYVCIRVCQRKQADKLVRLVCSVLRVLRISFPNLATSREEKEGVHACCDLLTVQVPTRSKVQVLKLSITRFEVFRQQWLWAQGWARVSVVFNSLCAGAGAVGYSHLHSDSRHSLG